MSAASGIDPRDVHAMYGAGFFGHTFAVVYTVKGARVMGMQCSDIARARAYVAEGREDATIYQRSGNGWRRARKAGAR